MYSNKCFADKKNFSYFFVFLLVYVLYICIICICTGSSQKHRHLCVYVYARIRPLYMIYIYTTTAYTATRFSNIRYNSIFVFPYNHASCACFFTPLENRVARKELTEPLANIKLASIYITATITPPKIIQRNHGLFAVFFPFISTAST